MAVSSCSRLIASIKHLDPQQVQCLDRALHIDIEHRPLSVGSFIVSGVVAPRRRWRVRRHDGHLGADSELLPGRPVARDLDVIFTLSGTGDIEGRLHPHERVHPHAECFLDT